MQVKLIPVLFFFLSAHLCLFRDTTTDRQIDIQGNTNQDIQIVMPYDQVISVKVESGSILEYVTILPKRFNLQGQKQSNILHQSSKTLLEELRTPFTSEYLDLFRINQKIIVFKPPFHFIVMQELKHSFVIVKQFKLDEMKEKEVKFVKIQQSYILILLSTSQMILLDDMRTSKQTNIFNSTEDIMIEQIFQNNKTCFMAFVGNTMHVILIQGGQISIKRSVQLAEKVKNLEISAIERGDFVAGIQQVWFVDEDTGLFLLTISPSLQILSGPTLIQQQKGCFQLDKMIYSHAFSLLLTCRLTQNSDFLMLLYDNDDPKYPFLLSKSRPYNQKCSADKYFFYKDYVLSQQAESLDIFVKANDIDGKEVYNKNWIAFVGINSFLLVQNKSKQTMFIYMISGGKIAKKELKEENYSVSLNSQSPLKQPLHLLVDFYCDKAATRLRQICQSSFTINLNIHNNIVSYVQYKSLNIAIMLSLVTIIISLALLCRYKYKYIYKKAYNEFRQLTNPSKCLI